MGLLASGGAGEEEGEQAGEDSAEFDDCCSHELLSLFSTEEWEHPDALIEVLAPLAEYVGEAGEGLPVTDVFVPEQERDVGLLPEISTK